MIDHRREQTLKNHNKNHIEVTVKMDKSSEPFTSTQSAILSKRRVAARPDIKAAKCSTAPGIETTTSSSRELTSHSSPSKSLKRTISSSSNRPRKKFFYNVMSFELVVPCRLGHRSPPLISLLDLLALPRPNIHHLLSVLNHHPEVCKPSTNANCLVHSHHYNKFCFIFPLLHSHCYIALTFTLLPRD